MKVIFDISTVGNNPKTRTGIARTAWSIADLLHQKLGDDVSFSAIGSVRSSLQIESLLHSLPDFKSAIYPASKFARNIEDLNDRASNNPNLATSSFVSKTKRSVLRNISRAINVTRQPIDPKVLAQADIFHSSYPRIPDRVRKTLPHRHLQTVYDLTPLLLDDKYFVPGQRGVTQRLIDTIQANDWVTTISDATRNDLLERRKLDPDRVVTVYLAAAPELFYPVSDSTIIEAAKQKYHLPEGNYFLTLHSLAPHKNVNHLIACFKQMILQERHNNVHLAICGGSIDAATSTIDDNQLTEADLEFIHFTGFVEDRDLAALYSGALSFIFPSLYEGFGLPVLEAMQCGCPAISSNTSSLPEVVGEAGFLVSPVDSDALCAAMLEISQNADLRSKYSQYSIDRAALFSWQKTVNATLEIYEKMMS